MEAMKLVTVTCDGWGMLPPLHEPVQGEVSYDSRRGQAPFQIPEKEVVSLSGIVNNKHGSKMLCPNKSNGFNV